MEAIFDYIAEFDCIDNADYVLDELMKIVDSLSRHHERGDYPKELVALGIKEYRQASFKTYRVIYRMMDSRVIIYLIAVAVAIRSRCLLAGCWARVDSTFCEARHRRARRRHHKLFSESLNR